MPYRLTAAIVGSRFHDGADRALASMRDDTELVLRREPENQYDSNAISIWHGAQHLGFVRAARAAELAPEMDARGLVEARCRYNRLDGRNQTITVELDDE